MVNGISTQTKMTRNDAPNFEKTIFNRMKEGHEY